MSLHWLYLAIACDVVCAVALRSHDSIGAAVFAFGCTFSATRVFKPTTPKAGPE